LARTDTTSATTMAGKAYLGTVEWLQSAAVQMYWQMPLEQLVPAVAVFEQPLTIPSTPETEVTCFRHEVQFRVETPVPEVLNSAPCPQGSTEPVPLQE